MFTTPLWEIILVGDKTGLSNLYMVTGEGKRYCKISKEWMRDDSFFKDTRKQLIEYLSGKREIFDVMINPQGTMFQKKVWRVVTTIPFSKVRTYKEIASAIQKEKASRAVGMAISKNPLPIIVPCHRVIGSDGRLTGFAHGLVSKQKLLALEKRYR